MKYLLTIMILAVALQNAASFCPETAGIGVYKARALLEMTDNYLFDTEPDCAEAGNRFDSDPSLNELAFTVNPNPATDFIYIKTTDPQNGENFFRLSDITGRVVLTLKANDDNATVRIPVAHLSAGIYFLQYIGAQQSLATRKIIISRN